MTIVENYKGIEVMKGDKGAFTHSEGTAKNAGRKFKNRLDSVVFIVNGKEFSFSVSIGYDYEDLKEITHQEIDLRIRQSLPKL
jgi:hypothetical protein